MATSAPDDAITISGEQYLKWYHASDDAKRGFCAECGSALFWKHEHETATSIMAGCFDAPTDLKVVKHIFMADKGDYYDISDGVEQFDDGGR